MEWIADALITFGKCLLLVSFVFCTWICILAMQACDDEGTMAFASVLTILFGSLSVFMLTLIF